MNFDDKLREILRDGALGMYMKNEQGEFVPVDWSRSPDSLFDPYIAEIKQAFTGEGWVDMHKGFSKEWNVYETKSGGGKPQVVAVLMGGKEWYDRFEKELPFGTEFPNHKPRSQYFYSEDILEAAKKASGIKDES